MVINDAYITSLLDHARNTPELELQRILDKADRFEGLTHQEVAALLCTDDPVHLARVYAIAGRIKRQIYGERVVIFAPLYISDYCVNKCAYCGFRCDHKFERHRLTMDEIREEVRVLETMGHKRLALEAGEDPKHAPIEYILEAINTIYQMKVDSGEIRRVNVNIAATTVENYQQLKEIGIGTYILFQETYHKPTYEAVHLSGPKADYQYHTDAFDRAMEAGIEDVGGGVLFGLYDYRYEVLSLMLHNEHLEQRFGVGFHTISVPRMCKAEGMDEAAMAHLPTDADFKKLVAIIRLAVPYTGMIVSTRETLAMRAELLKIGISQVSAGSAVDVGGYSHPERGSSQFQINDERDAQDIITWLMEQNLVPSFCTACYRKGRTGDRFMSLAKTGNIKNVCLPNALLTLCEYANDYGKPAFKEKAEQVIAHHLPNIDNEDVRALVTVELNKVRNGQRDLYL